jgi:hypothetical protein
MVSSKEDKGDMGLNQLYFLGAIGIDLRIKKDFLEG